MPGTNEHPDPPQNPPQKPAEKTVECGMCKRRVPVVLGTWSDFVLSPIRWHHVDERAGQGLTPPPALGADAKAVLADWAVD